MKTAKPRTALFATVETPFGPQTVRLGKTQTESSDRSLDQWYRVDNRRGGYENRLARPCYVVLDGTAYRVRHFEVRRVDENGRGLGSERHADATPVPFRALRTSVRFAMAQATA